MKIRKKPIILDAITAQDDGSIQTEEGEMSYLAGDVIITGIHGEKYPCKRAIFDESYDIIEEDLA